MQRTLPTYCLIALCALASPALAADYVITVKDKQFSPANLTFPAGQKITLTIKNLDPTPVEFESTDLNREKVIAANGGEVKVFIGPLDAGTYTYIDDFNRANTGTLTAE